MSGLLTRSIHETKNDNKAETDPTNRRLYACGNAGVRDVGVVDDDDVCVNLFDGH